MTEPDDDDIRRELKEVVRRRKLRRATLENEGARPVWKNISMIGTLAIYCLEIVLPLLCTNPFTGHAVRVDWPTLALPTVNFQVVLWLLMRFRHRPVCRMTEEREAVVRKAAQLRVCAAMLNRCTARGMPKMEPFAVVDGARAYRPRWKR